MANHKPREAISRFFRRGSRPARPSKGWPQLGIGHLGVMRRCRGHDAAEWGSSAIGRVDVQLVPDPGGGTYWQIPWTLRLVPTSQALGRSASICGRRASSFQLPSSSRLGSFACASPLQAGAAMQVSLRRRFGFAAFGFGAGILPRFNRRRIPRDCGSTRWPIHRSAQSASHADGWPGPLSSANSEFFGPRKRRLARKPAGTAPAAQPSIACRQPARRSIRLARSSERRTASALVFSKALRQRRAVLQVRPPCLAAEVGQIEPATQSPVARTVMHEQLVGALAHWANLALEPREQLLLKAALYQ